MLLSDFVQPAFYSRVTPGCAEYKEQPLGISESGFYRTNALPVIQQCQKEGKKFTSK